MPVEYESLAGAVADVCGAKILEKRAVPGGDINRAYVLSLSNGDCAFVKENARANRDFFRAEAEGLAAMEQTGAVRTPAVLAAGTDGDRSFLLMTYISSGRPGPHTMEQLGRDLAAMHTADTAAFLPEASGIAAMEAVDARPVGSVTAQGATIGRYGFVHDNYIGSGFQLNTPKDSWISFFRECRLRPQFARAGGYFETTDKKKIERLLDHLDQYLAEPSHPSLLHGDFWAGNYMVDMDSAPWLIDPAAYVGHAEADLAMTELFGGFDQAFYGAYKEAAGLSADYRDRRDLYNLYHLLNHLNLFGGSYLSSVLAILHRYA